MRWSAALALAGVAALAALPASASSTDCLGLAALAESKWGIPPTILQAIVLVESGTPKGPHPFAINLNGKAFYPSTVEEARRILLADDGTVQPADVGCGQISMRFHLKAFNGRPEWALIPDYNLAFAAQLLLSNYRDTGSWTAAVARYHSGEPQRQWAYVCRVLRQMGRLQGRVVPAPPHCRADGPVMAAAAAKAARENSTVKVSSLKTDGDEAGTRTTTQNGVRVIRSGPATGSK